MKARQGIGSDQLNIHKNTFKRQEKLQDLLFDMGLDYDLRDAQNKSLDWSKDKIKEGKKFIIVEMATGVGKSIYALYLIKHYLDNIDSDCKIDLLTNTKILQEQYTKEFKYMNNLWGKSNYSCTEWDTNCKSGSICNKQNKKVCEYCPHKDALQKWLDGRISITNFHTHGLYSLYIKKMIEARKSDLLIVDEAHLLEETINGFVSFILSSDKWKKFFKSNVLGILETELYPIMDTEDVCQWIIDRLIPELESSSFSLHSSLKKTDSSDNKKYNGLLSAISDITSYIQTITNFVDEYEKKSCEWILDKNTKDGKTTIEVRPLWTSGIMRDKIWSNYNQVVLMSATFVDPNLYCELNGIDPSEAAFLRVPSPFPIKNRPIFYHPIAKMTWKNKINAWKQYKPTIDKILKKYKGKKGIIHSGNYELSKWMKNDYGDNSRFIFAEPSNRKESLEEHHNRTDDCILVSPSMIHGVDLKDDLSRFQVILKMPYPNLASEINKTRNKLNKKWYGWKTVADVIQAYGRSIRSDTDYADTIILDECFGDVIKYNKNMFPQYFLDAIRTIR